MQGWTPDELRVVFGIKDVTETAEDVEFVKRVSSRPDLYNKSTARPDKSWAQYWAGDSEGRSQIYYGTT